MPPESQEPKEGPEGADAYQPPADGHRSAEPAGTPIGSIAPGVVDVASPDFGPSPVSSTAFQLLALAVSNGVVLFVVWLVHETTEPHKIPAFFIVSSLSIVAASLVLLGLSEILRNASLLTNDVVSDEEETQRLISAQPKGFSAWWLQHRTDIQRFFVILLSALMVVGLDRLVHATGGGTRSPFMPLLEAPAVLGPFMATNWRGVVLSAGAVSTFIWYEIHTGPLPKGSDYGRTSHASVVILVIVVAAGISAAQKFVKARRIKKTQEARDRASGQAVLKFQPKSPTSIGDPNPGEKP